MTAPALHIAMLVGNLTDAIADVVELLGNEDTRKLLVGLAEGLGAPEDESDRSGTSVSQARGEGPGGAEE